MENHCDHSTLGAEAPCLPDTSQIDRNDLMIDIMRLPMMQFQAICCGIRNNMSPDELAKMVSSWTEERVRKNILQAMAELEERTNILSSSYQDRMQHKHDLEKKAPEVQLAPVTKEVFVTVLDSIKSPTSDETTSGSKQHFISYVHGMVDKIKDFPKLFKASHKQSSELNITPAVCESLSELLALPDPEKRSTTCLHDSTDRLCTEDEISRASKGVSGILLTPGGSLSQQDITEIQQPQSSSTSLASARSVHDNARGIVDTIVTDLEDLYESLEPKEVEMIQSQTSALTEIETALEDDATQKKFHNKVFQILCSAQVKLRMFFTMHRSEDIIPDSKTDLATEETGNEGNQLVDSCKGLNLSDAEGQDDVSPQEHENLIHSSTYEHAADECTGISNANTLGELTNESQIQALSIIEQQATVDMVDSEALPCTKDEHIPPYAIQPEPKDKKRSTRKGLKIFLPKNNVFKTSMTPDTAREIQETVSSLEESTVDTSIPENLSYTTESELETTSFSSIASPETATVEVIQHCETSSPTAPQFICKENEMTMENEITMGEKFKRFFSKSPNPALKPPESIDTVSSLEEKAVETQVPDMESYTCKADEQSSKGTLVKASPSDDTGEGDGTSVTEIIQSIEPSSTPTTPETKDNRQNVGKRFKALFTRSPKPIDLEPLTQADPPVLEAEMTDDTLDDSQAPDTEVYMTTSEQDIPIKNTSETKHSHSVGKKIITLFTKSPKPIDVDPGMQIDEAITELPLTLDSKTTDETPIDSWAAEAEATLQSTTQTSTEACLQHPPAEAVSESKNIRFNVSKKMKMIFIKSPKPIDTEPAIQGSVLEVAPSIDSEMTDEILDDRCAADAEAVLDPYVHTSDETFIQHSPAKDIPESKAIRFSVSKKMKTLFTKSPKSIDTEPALQEYESVPEVCLSIDSEMIKDTLVDNCAPDAEATLQPSMETSKETSLQRDPAKAIPESKDNRFSVGKKMKTLFNKSPKLGVGPVGTDPFPDSETVYTHDNESTIQQELLSPLNEMETMSESTECSHAVLRTVAETFQSPEMGQSQVMAPISETSASMTATMVGNNTHLLSTKFKNIFVKHTKKTSDEPAVPVVSQEVANKCPNPCVPALCSETIVSQTYQATVLPSVNMSFLETPRREDIFETGGTASPPVNQKGPSPDMTGPNVKSVHFSIGEKLKQFFLRPKPAVSAEISSFHFPEGFHSISEATVALKNLTDRIVLHLDDTDTARAKLEVLVSRGVLRPFTDDLVNRVYGFLSGSGGSTETGIEISRYASEPAIHTARAVEEGKRELIVERDSEIAHAFAVKSIQALLRQLLEMLLPLLEDVDTSGCQVLDTVTDIMAREVASSISLDHLAQKTADTDDTDDYSESSVDFEGASSTRTTMSGRAQNKTLFSGMLDTFSNAFKPSKVTSSKKKE